MQNMEHFELYKTLSNEAIVALIALDRHSGQFIYTNKLANSLFELQSDALQEYSIENFMPYEDNKNFRPFTKEMLQIEAYYQDVLIKKSNQIKFVGNIRIKSIQIDNRDITLFMCHDVTLQRKLQRELTSKQQEIEKAYQELLLQNAHLKELDLAKTRFIALTTHELRTPLSAMVGSSEVLKEKLYDTDEEREEFINMIHEQGQHLMELVNDILDFAKITSNKMDFFIHQQDLNPVIKGLMGQFEAFAAQSQIQLILNIINEPHICYFDEVRIKQIISNIISNAIKYNKPQGSVEVLVKREEKAVAVYVKDTGKGIAKEQIAQVFNEFETLGKVANHQKGTGLGMPITKRLIECMGGTINIESELEVGSTFWVTIPTDKILSDEFYRERTDNFDLAA